MGAAELRSLGSVRETAQQVRRVILEDPALYAFYDKAGDDLYPVPWRAIFDNPDRWRGYACDLPADIGSLLLHVFTDGSRGYWSATLTFDAVPGGALVRAAGGYVLSAGDRPGVLRRSIRPPSPEAVDLVETARAELGRLGMLADDPADDRADREPAGVGGVPADLDDTDRQILDLATADPDLTDSQIGARLYLTRQAVNVRRRALEKMGFRVR
ncbi:MAG TPA: winged helix-turn-helix domain-containing protein [candidate division Zixibacteria bacterium]|nr:winged helix-turn-helix domain-containing protein [candidate division Zixibacteria bacterium]